MDQPLASRGSRLGAILIDNIAVLIALLPGGIAVVSAANSFGNDGMGGALFLLAIGFLGVVAAQVYLLVWKGQTIGKRILSLRIVNRANGELLGAGRILFLRTLLPGFISGIPYVGWLFPFVDALFIFREDRRCIHDHMAQSIVVEGSPMESGSGAGDTPDRIQ
jgi:uncharacterized RDD family membrane protein YckC